MHTRANPRGDYWPRSISYGGIRPWACFLGAEPHNSASQEFTEYIPRIDQRRANSLSESWRFIRLGETRGFVIKYHFNGERRKSRIACRIRMGTIYRSYYPPVKSRKTARSSDVVGNTGATQNSTYKYFKAFDFNRSSSIPTFCLSWIFRLWAF